MNDLLFIAFLFFALWSPALSRRVNRNRTSINYGDDLIQTSNSRVWPHQINVSSVLLICKSGPELNDNNLNPSENICPTI